MLPFEVDLSDSSNQSRREGPMTNEWERINIASRSSVSTIAFCNCMISHNYNNQGDVLLYSKI